MAELSWHVEAVRDLESIAAYIAHDAPASASQFVARIIDAAERLKLHPRLGRVIPEIRESSYREVLYQNYRIAYRLTGEDVTILAVVHAAMDMERQIEQREWDLT